jgi:hypothetical protein
MFGEKSLPLVTAVLLVILLPGCARRAPLEPPGRADVRLIGKPAMYSSTEGPVWVGEVKNYGYKMAEQILIIITFRGGDVGLGVIDTYDNNLRPNERAEYEVYRNARNIDTIKVTWQERNEAGVPVCHSYLYEYLSDFLYQEGKTACD